VLVLPGVAARPVAGLVQELRLPVTDVREPREVLAEFGVTLPGTAAISVWDSTSEARYMVLPGRPAGTEALDAGQLAALVTRNGLIGTALV
jgi:nitrile hydratase